MADRKSSLLDLVSSMFVSPANATFLGEETPGADKKALARAKTMDAGGQDRDAIWKTTGFYKTKDGKWMYEVSDHDASLKDWVPKAVGSTSGVTKATMGDVLDHPSLYAADPGKRSAPVQLGGMLYENGEPDPNVSGVYDETKDTTYLFSPSAKGRQALPTLLHETQHRAADRARVDYGPTDTVAIRDDLTKQVVQDNLADLRRQLVEARRRGDTQAISEIQAELSRPLRNLMAEQALHESYRRRQGEVQARNVETRMTMSPEERWARPPWLTEDVPWSLVRVSPRPTR